MYIFLSVLQVLTALSLVVLILLQGGEGADIGAVFGGGSSQTVFGGRGPATFLAKGTIVLAGLFLLTSIALTVLASRGTTRSVIANLPAHSLPAALAIATACWPREIAGARRVQPRQDGHLSPTP